MELDGRGSRRLSSSYVVVSPLRQEHEYEDSSLSNPTAEYCLPKTAQDDSHYEVPVNSAPLQLVVSEQKARLSRFFLSPMSIKYYTLQCFRHRMNLKRASTGSRQKRKGNCMIS